MSRIDHLVIAARGMAQHTPEAMPTELLDTIEGLGASVADVGNVIEATAESLATV